MHSNASTTTVEGGGACVIDCDSRHQLSWNTFSRTRVATLHRDTLHANVRSGSKDANASPPTSGPVRPSTRPRQSGQRRSCSRPPRPAFHSPTTASTGAASLSRASIVSAIGCSILRPSISRPFAARGVGDETTGIRAVASYVRLPCPRCGGSRFESRPHFPPRQKSEEWRALAPREHVASLDS